MEADSGPVDLLVNNAGFCFQGAFDELPADAFERQMLVNFFSAVSISLSFPPDHFTIPLASGQLHACRSAVNEAQRCRPHCLCQLGRRPMRHLVCFGLWNCLSSVRLENLQNSCHPPNTSQGLFRLFAIEVCATCPGRCAPRGIAAPRHRRFRPLSPEHGHRGLPGGATHNARAGNQFLNKTKKLMLDHFPIFLPGPPDQQLGWRVQPRAGGLRLCGLPSHRPILDLPGHGGQNAGFVSGSRVAGAKSPEGIGTGKHIEFPLWIWNMVIVEFSCSDLLGRTCSRCDAHLRGPILCGHTEVP
jgi:hypothetical protein